MEQSMKRRMYVGGVLLSFALIGLLSMNGLVPYATAQLSGLLSQGLTMTMTTTANGRTTTATHYFSGNASKSVSADGNDSIVRFDQQKLISIDNKKKTYSEMTFQQIQEMADKLSNSMAGISENPEAAAAIKKMMGGGSSAPLTVTRQGPGEAIAGYATEKYLVAGPLDMEIWAAPELKVPTTYYDAVKIRIPANPMFDLRQMYDAFKQINGWPVKYVMTMKMMGRTMTTTNEVTSVQKGAIPPAIFEIPAGYQKIQDKF
jgi:hypothetical protein